MTPVTAVFEFVDDTTTRIGSPTGAERSVNQRAGNDRDLGRGIFPGLDENNPISFRILIRSEFPAGLRGAFFATRGRPAGVSLWHGYEQQYVVDRFEDDELPDYPYKVDRQGFNVNWSIEILPSGRFVAGARRYQHHLVCQKCRQFLCHVHLPKRPASMGPGAHIRHGQMGRRRYPGRPAAVGPGSRMPKNHWFRLLTRW